MLGLIKKIGEEEKKERGKGIWEWTGEEFIEQKGGKNKLMKNIIIIIIVSRKENERKLKGKILMGKETKESLRICWEEKFCWEKLMGHVRWAEGERD